MSYRRVLVSRWSRRDRMAVVVIAAAVAFLTGTALVVLAVGSSTATIAAGFGTEVAVSDYPSVAAAESAADTGDLVVPVAEVRGPTGAATVVGVPANTTVAGVALRDGRMPTGPVGEPDTVRFVGEDGTTERRIGPREAGVFPSDWYVTDPRTVAELGATSGLVVEPTTGVPGRGVPLRGVLAFFLAGTRSALWTLSVAAAVGATLVGVTVYSVTRMTVRDRLDELFLLRASGATRWQIRRLFVSRGGLLLGVGVALGYALGVIATNLAVNVAVATGVPTSLSPRVTVEAARILLATYGGVFAVGIVASLAAVQPELQREPVEIETARRVVRLPRLRPRLLSERTAVPTAATLAAFVTFLLVVAGLASVAGPLASAESATITEPGAPHPIASQVPASYAEPLRARGIAASPEILLFAVRDGQPFPARGANYSAFARLNDAHLVAGRAPTEPAEAVIGTDLASTLGVDVGDRLLVGGSVDESVARVRVVGAFAADGPDDDQLVVSLATARQLANVRDGQVNIIRAERLPSTDGSSGGPALTDARGPVVTDVRIPESVAAGDPVTVRVTVRNDGLSAQAVDEAVRFGDATRPVNATVPAGEQRTVRLRFPAVEPGEYTVTAGDVSQTISVLAADAVQLQDVPASAPPDSRPRIRVVDARGEPVANVTVATGDWRGSSSERGYVRVPLAEVGNQTVTTTRGEATDAAPISVDGDAARRLDAEVRLRPRRPSLLDEPTLVVTLSNRWHVPLNRSVSIAVPGGPFERRVTVGPGEQRRLELALPRQPPGRYDVTVRTTTGTLAATDYRVTGDERVVAALATGGHAGTSGIGQAVQVALGNLELAVAALVLLGGGMTVGGAAATFAGAVHANRETIGLYRAFGATRWQVVRLVLADALRLGVAASLAAILAGLAAVELLGTAGLLTVYGVEIATTPSVELLAAVVVGCLVVVTLGAGIAVVSVVSRPPATLLAGGDQT